MDPDDLTTLLAAPADEDASRSPFCPDEHAIGGYVDGGLGLQACEAIERHAAGCSHCLSLIGLLMRERRDATREPVPAAIVAQARALAPEEPQRRWRLAPQWAFAAALILAVPLLLQIGRMERGIEGQGRPEPPAARTLALPAGELRLLSPAEGATVDAERLAFRWSEVVGTPFYDVRIVTDAGDVVVAQRVEGTSWSPPKQVELRAGAEYFVHVDAYPSGDKAVGSDHVMFRVAD